MDEHAGYRELLVTTTTLARDAEALGGDLAVLIAQPGGQIAAWLERLRVQAALVRPDRYLAGTALDREDLVGLLARHAARCCRTGRAAARAAIAAP